MSPREAEGMDPRQRLLLQEAWKALEDAGYGLKKIKKKHIGMFVGVDQIDYQLGSSFDENITSNNNAILAARLSYFLNLFGPSMAINTTCSSGLVAAHQAILNLHQRECDTAIAAGVNLVFTPEAFIRRTRMGMLSPDGKCFAFDMRANGIVPGEAIVAIVLKRLSQAEADRDPIYATIEGSYINYDGKTNGITAPSGVSQFKLLKSLYEKYQVNPEDIEYIIPHGTGTRLGDSVEINGLYDTFKHYTQKQGFCALTSTKTNFGHTFAASGLVSLVSLVQAFCHEIIPASLHCEKENDYIHWAESPFYVNKQNKKWPKSREKRRMGAVSSFGISGTNAHMVLKDYIPKEDISRLGENIPYFLLILSAKSFDSLTEKIKDMIQLLEQNDEQNLFDISYTLMEGRQHFNYRCAIVIQDVKEAVYVLKQAGNKERTHNLFQGTVSHDFTGLDAIKDLIIKQGEELRENTNKYKETLYVLADFYCQGYNLSWDNLYGDVKPHMIHLPTYPFEKNHFGIKELSCKKKMGLSPVISDVIHPLVHQNTSNFSEHRFTSFFTGSEFFLKDYLIRGQHVLPGLSFLEMVRVAVQNGLGFLTSREGIGLKLKDVIWSSPVPLGKKGKEVHVSLSPEVNNNIIFEIYSNSKDPDIDPIIHNQGIVQVSKIVDSPRLDLKALQSECNYENISLFKYYENFKKPGNDYAPGYQGIDVLYPGQKKALVKLTLTSNVVDCSDRLCLHPALLDAALHAAGLMIINNDPKSEKNVEDYKPVLPFALEELEIFKSYTSSMWVLISQSDTSTIESKMHKFNIELFDEDGKVCVRMKGFSFVIWDEDISFEKKPVIAQDDKIILAKTTDQNDDVTDQMIEDHIKTIIQENIAEILKMETKEIHDDLSFTEYGLDSIMGRILINLINDQCNITLDNTVLVNYNNINELCRQIMIEHKEALIISLQENKSAQKKIVIQPTSEQKQIYAFPII
ncbi:MAG: beta-ketoacyl synthase N-terminal-like domain-containing protein, partial [Candidatus Pacearchaeota archaeon]|nr:beta-ketoacyl synthase N-terminal-like domain-containing protein [Candidatus Pacearchaeota archaeon]